MSKEPLTHSDRYVRKTNRIILIIGIIALFLFLFGLLLIDTGEEQEEQTYEVESSIEAETDLNIAGEANTESEIEFDNTHYNKAYLDFLPYELEQDTKIYITVISIRNEQYQKYINKLGLN